MRHTERVDTGVLASLRRPVNNDGNTIDKGPSTRSRAHVKKGWLETGGFSDTETPCRSGSLKRNLYCRRED